MINLYKSSFRRQNKKWTRFKNYQKMKNQKKFWSFQKSSLKWTCFSKMPTVCKRDLSLNSFEENPVLYNCMINLVRLFFYNWVPRVLVDLVWGSTPEALLTLYLVCLNAAQKALPLSKRKFLIPNRNHFKYQNVSPIWIKYGWEYILSLKRLKDKRPSISEKRVKSMNLEKEENLYDSFMIRILTLSRMLHNYFCVVYNIRNHVIE